MAIAQSGRARAGAPVVSVKHVVVLMQENRSFDHYFGQLANYGLNVAKPPRYTAATAPEAEPADATNPNPVDPHGPPIAAFHQKAYCEVADLNHSWNGTHNEYDNGQMDGFTAANINAADPTGHRTMGYYDQTDLPFYYDLYSTFGTSDRQFASVLTQTFPNRFYLLAGTSFGHIANDFPPPGPEFTQTSVFNRLDEHGVSWRIYVSQIAFALEFGYVRNNAAGHVFPISQYYVDAASGNLPQVSYVDPIFLGPTNVENDEHPSSNIQVGQKFVSDVVGALFRSPNWSSSALFLTYDEHGGFYDHVAPPAAPAPDAIAPMLKPTDYQAGFDRFGIRVPLAVISPYSRRSFVSHVNRDHTSILRFIEDDFGLGTLTNRDAAADDMTEFFNFKHPPFSAPPALAAATVDPTQAAACSAAPPNGTA
jgi:phospholipase C